MKETLDYIEAGLPDLDGAKIAYIVECAAQNLYCQRRWEGAQEAAKEVNAEVTLFDAGFDPAAQQSQVEDAILRDFDGYVLAPVADASGCAAFEELETTGKPIANINSPMCGNSDYTDGTVGFVAMQTEEFFTDVMRNAFSSCTGDCKVVSVGGFVGSDLFTRWQNGIEIASAEFPNVDVVANQPGNFDPAVALSVVQDALSAHPDIDLVVSPWDDMTRGIEEGIRAAGKVPGEDVQIHSVAGTKYGVQKVKEGAWTSTTILLPREEAYYGMIQLARALADGESTPGFASLADAPAVVDGPGTIFITSENADQFNPEY